MAVWNEIWTPDATVTNKYTKNVGWNPKGVLIDNYTPYFIYLPDGDSFIAPQFIGATRSLQHTTNFAIAEWQHPFGLPQIKLTPDFFVHFAWTDQPVSYSAGISISPNSGASSVTISAITAILGFTTGFIATRVALGVTAVPLPATPMVNRKSLMLQADPLNTDFIFIGGPSVTSGDTDATKGIVLAAGMSMPVDTDGAIPYGIAKSTQYCLVMEGV